MAYAKINWENYPSQATPIDEDNLNHMENGIEEAVTGLDLKVDKTDYDAFVEQLLPVDTESGNPAIITDAFGGAVKALSVTFTPIQSGSGTPSPTNVRPISGLTEVDVNRYGKNLIYESEIVQGGFNNGVPQSGILIRCSIYNFIKVTPGSKYTLSATSSKAVKGLLMYYTTDASDYSGTNGNSGFQTLPYTFTIPNGINYVCVGFGYTDNTNITPSSIVHPQFEEGETVSTPETYIVDLDGTRYGGTVDFKTGVLTVTHVLATLTVTAVGYSQSAQTNYADVHSVTVIEDAPSISSAYTQINHNATGYEGAFKVYLDALTFYDIRFTSVSAAQTVLNDVQVAYPLTTPITVQLTPDEVTLLRLNNVLTTNGANISVSYSADVQAYIDKKVAEGSTSRSVDTSSLTKSGSTESTEEVTKTVESEEK